MIRYRRIFFSFLQVCSILLLFIGVPAVVKGQSLPNLRLKERKAGAWFQKALTFYNRGQYDASREFFYKALNIQPHFHLARRYLGDSYYYSGEWSKALGQWEFLNQSSRNKFLLVNERIRLLRLALNRLSPSSQYVHLHSYQSNKWLNYNFQKPTDIHLDKQGRIYLASYKSSNIIKLSPSIKPLQELRSSIFNRLGAPMGITVEPKTRRLYVCDYQKDLIRVFSPKGRELFRFGGRGAQPGQFHGPSGIAIYKDSVFVSDSGNRRVQKFSLDGVFMLETGTQSKTSPLLYPAGLAINRRAEILYLADKDGGRIFKFDLNGNLLGTLDSEYLSKPRGLDFTKKRLLITDEKKGIVFYHPRENRWAPLNTGDGFSSKEGWNFKRPFSARMSKTGVIYVADYGNDSLTLLVPLHLKITNLKCKIQRIDTRSFPQIAVFVSLSDQFGNTLTGLGKKSMILYENDVPVSGLNTKNMKLFNKSVKVAIVKENSPFYRQNFDANNSTLFQWLTDSLKITDLMYLIRAGRDARMVYKGTAVRQFVRKMGEGETKEEPNLSKGLYEAISRLSSEIGPRAVILTVSGRYNKNLFSQYSSSRIQQFAKAHQIPIYVISYESSGKSPLGKEKFQPLGVQQEINITTEQEDIQVNTQASKEILRELAEATGGKYIQAFDEIQLRDLYELIRSQKDERYILTYKTILNQKHFQGRYIDLRLNAKYAGTHGIAEGGFFIL